MSADVQAAEAAVRSAQAGAGAARQKIGQAQAGVEQARGVLASTTTQRGYTEVNSPIDGVVTQRVISPGQFVSPGQAILRATQIHPIRLQANVPEVDLAQIRVGARVIVTTQGTFKKPVVAHVTSITPTVDPVARTGIVEAVVTNRDERFQPGQFVTMEISTGRNKSSLQAPIEVVRTRTPPGKGVLAGGTTSYVWIAEPVSGEENQYTVKPTDVRIGASDSVSVEIVSGLHAGQQVVLSGNEYLKTGDTVASRDPLPSGEPPAAMASTLPMNPSMPGMDHTSGAFTNQATVEVSSKGFTPASVSLRAGIPARLVFIRKDTQNCATEIVLPDYQIRKALVLNQPVVIEFTPRRGEVAFTCNMNMLSGKVVVK
jgi:RND family efflux transporter MFP subunit